MRDRFRSKTVALAFVASLLGAGAVQAEPGAPACPARWGAPGQPLVANAETARAIFLAVERDFFPQADLQTYPAVDVHDDGDRWAVFRHRPSVRLPSGELEITRGGGQLELTIAKCDAAISGVHFSR